MCAIILDWSKINLQFKIPFNLPDRDDYELCKNKQISNREVLTWISCLAAWSNEQNFLDIVRF